LVLLWLYRHKEPTTITIHELQPVNIALYFLTTNSTCFSHYNWNIPKNKQNSVDQRILLLFQSAQLFGAACGEKVKASQAKLDSIKQLNKVLNSVGCLRDPNDTERMLFTSGHKDKFNRLAQSAYHQFKIYNEAQQFAYAGVKARKYLSSIRGDLDILQKYLFGLKSVCGTVSVGRLYDFSYDPDYLIAAQNYWLRVNSKNSMEPKQLKVPMRQGVIDKVKLLGMTKEAYEGLSALAFDQVNPGFIKDLAKTHDELITAAKVEKSYAVVPRFHLVVTATNCLALCGNLTHLKT